MFSVLLCAHSKSCQRVRSARRRRAQRTDNAVQVALGLPSISRRRPKARNLFTFSCSLFLALFGLLELETHISGGREKEEVQEEVEHTGRFYFCADLRLLVFKVKLSPSSSLLVVVLVSKWPIRKSWYSIEILKSLVRHIRSPNCCTLIVWHNWRKPCEYASHDYII